MTPEEIKSFLEDEKNAETFKSIAEAMGYESRDAISGLKSALEKERENAKNLKNNLEETRKKLDGIDLEEYIELREKSSGGAAKKDDNSKLERDLKNAIAKIEALESEKSSIFADFAKSKIHESLNSSFDAGGIDPIHKTVLLNAFAGKAKFSDGEVYMPHNGLEIPASEYFSEWVKSDGKPYLKKEINSGAGSSGFQGSTGKTEFTRQDLSTPEGRKAYLEASKKGDAQIKQ